MSKDHAYAYEAGYRDGSVHYELEHCPACKNVADLQEALSENAKLRSQCADLVDERERLFHANVEKNSEILRLVGESAKLRELCANMWACISHIGEYDAFYYDMAKDGCGISCIVNGKHCCADKLYDRTRELGIEV